MAVFLFAGTRRGIELGMVRGNTPYIRRKAHENPKVVVRAKRSGASEYSPTGY